MGGEKEGKGKMIYARAESTRASGRRENEKAMA